MDVTTPHVAISSEQKVVAVFLRAWDQKHQATEELLNKELSEGWRVVSMSSAGGATEAAYVGVWVTCLLERPRRD